ncbi:MAG: GNAT family N-acetyltransferase [Candidatus Rokuibacteriota bacterium]
MGSPREGTRAALIALAAPEHHAEALALIGAVYAEYGMTFEPEDWDRDLRDIAGHYGDTGGAFWVLLDDGRVVGTVAMVPLDPVTVEMKRVYLHPDYRGRGLGRALLEHAMGWAAAAGHRAVVAWSDVRLIHAHPVYDRLGFHRIGERTVDDADRSHEIGFHKAL